MYSDESKNREAKLIWNVCSKGWSVCQQVMLRMQWLWALKALDNNRKGRGTNVFAYTLPSHWKHMHACNNAHTLKYWNASVRVEEKLVLYACVHVFCKHRNRHV